MQRSTAQASPRIRAARLRLTRSSLNSSSAASLPIAESEASDPGGEGISPNTSGTCGRRRWIAPPCAGILERKLREETLPDTLRNHVMLLSSIFENLKERGLAQANPVRELPKSARRLYRVRHDPRHVPFIEKLSDVRRIYLDLSEPLNVAYAIGALAGLHTSEVFALKWRSVDLENRRIIVRESVTGPVKDDDSRIVPILNSLLPILAGWKLKSGGSDGLVIPPVKRANNSKFIDVHRTPAVHLPRTLERLELARPKLGWYEATRHTIASQWVLSGGSIEKLREMMGHHSVTVTERYAHVRPDLFTEKDLGTIAVDLSGGAVVKGNWAAKAMTSTLVRLILPPHLRTLAKVDDEVKLEITGPVTQRSVLDALEAKYPALCGTIRDHVTQQRRPFLRFFACEEDLSHESPDAALPDAVARGAEPLVVLGAIAGG
jgi:sulfur-carrier protein